MQRLNRKQWLATCLSQLYWAGQVPERGNGHRTRTLSPAFLFSHWSLHILSHENFKACVRIATARLQEQILDNPSVISGKNIWGEKEEQKTAVLAVLFVPVTFKSSLIRGLRFLSHLPSPHYNFRFFFFKKKHPTTKKHHRILRQHLLTFNWLWQASQVASTAMHFNTAPFTFLHFSHFSNSFEHCGFRLLA